MLEYNMGLEIAFMLGPVVAERALELGLFAALVALVPRQVLDPLVRFAAVTALVPQAIAVI